MINRIYELLDEVQGAFIQLDKPSIFEKRVNDFKLRCARQIHLIQTGESKRITAIELIADYLINRMLGYAYRPSLSLSGMPTIGGRKTNTSFNNDKN